MSGATFGGGASYVFTTYVTPFDEAVKLRESTCKYLCSVSSKSAVPVGRGFLEVWILQPQDLWIKVESKLKSILSEKVYILHEPNLPVSSSYVSISSRKYKGEILVALTGVNYRNLCRCLVAMQLQCVQKFVILPRPCFSQLFVYES